ncbi:putative peroxiredoxin YgaF [Halolactibacillus alkaliphilus]|uniref:thioredoxin-dependent peroxiredoxin n=1 Tax=Halolactibacillus alkaliphilus TaxID=442899 RepID=A0A511X4V9_9BACI|nr:peroxiredoxin [Halolactibacillus alkaliphilus]GEN57980.1 putative peroxiredoxin YgaF [Halolactibacillus alkaliphilus]GGN75998.1 putative peroxiredoxin YgaF [Halolactibacillus alkaliphilus]SFP09970.1 peroxiredoxin Q/BCP [Halolactibacillus alkaliphilus]
MAVTIGSKVPRLPMITSEGDEISLLDFKGKKLVLYFYPKDETPGCTREACEFRDLHDEFEKIGAEVVGVSPDSKESHEKFKEKLDLAFNLLVDEKHHLAEEFGVWVLKEKNDMTYHGNERSTFIIDEEGIIQKEFRGVSVPGHAAEILAEIKKM